VHDVMGVFRRASPQMMFGAPAQVGRIHTYGVFLPKHRRGNPGGYMVYFVQNDDGTYSLVEETAAVRRR
jgi:hypothetical protein